MNVLSVKTADLDPSANARFEWFWDPDIDRLSPEGRVKAYAAKRAVGDTQLVLTLDQSGLFSLDHLLNIIEEAVTIGGLTGCLLFCMGDGNDPGERDHDAGALGYSWLMRNFVEIVSRVKARGLLPFVIFVPGFDGVIPAWQPWTRVETFMRHARHVLGPDGYLAMELGAGFWCYSGERDDYDTDAAKCVDVWLYEFPPDMGPPDDPAPSNYAALSDSEKNRWSQVWQVSKRVLGPYFKRPSDMPKDEDPGQFTGGPLTHTTPRGPYFVSAFEFDTFTRTKTANRTPDAVTERRRKYLKAIGWPWVS